MAEEKELKAAVELADRKIGEDDSDKSDGDKSAPGAGNAGKGGGRSKVDPKLTAERDAAKTKYADLLKRMAAADRQLSQLVTVDPVSVAELGRLMPPDTALVQYLATRDKLLIWVIRGGRIDGRTVDVSLADLHARVRDYRMLMQNFSSTDYLGRELSDLLLKPIEPLIEGAARLAVVPHQNLHFVPFAALPYGDKDVLDKFAVYYLDSATVARFTHGDAAPGNALGHGATVLALANPETPEKTAELPFTTREAEVIGRYFPKVTTVTGDAAREARVRDDASDYDVLHIASHGEFKPTSPGDSRLLLAAGEGQDGNLSVTEIFGLATKADMVTLSACETGLGKLSSGDEVVGLDRAFFYAGARTVVSSLWRISDVTSAVVMKRFYRYLAEGQDKAEAMRQAQMIVRRYHAHPAYWSSYRVVGAYR
jgi:CHAT domain-containing protein